MSNRPEFARGVLCGMLLVIASSAMYWFITPSAHPDASTARTVAVGMQAVIGLLGAWWLARTPARKAVPPRGESAI